MFKCVNKIKIEKGKLDEIHTQISQIRNKMYEMYNDQFLPLYNKNNIRPELLDNLRKEAEQIKNKITDAFNHEKIIKIRSINENVYNQSIVLYKEFMKALEEKNFPVILDNLNKLRDLTITDIKEVMRVYDEIIDQWHIPQRKSNEGEEDPVHSHIPIIKPLEEVNYEDKADEWSIIEGDNGAEYLNERKRIIEEKLSDKSIFFYFDDEVTQRFYLWASDKLKVFNYLLN